MTPPTSASPRKAAPTLDDATDAKLKFISAAYAASPLRAVEKYPWTAVGAAAAATLGLTVITASPVFKFATSGLLTQGLGLAATLLKSSLGGQLTQGISQGVAKAVGGDSDDSPTTHS